jgi:tetratricopeptide (TPR) repeat protein
LWIDSPLLNKTPEVGRGAFALQQLGHPLVRIADPSNIVLQWRLAFPIIGHALYLPPWLYLALPHIGCVVVTAYTAHLMLRQGAGWLAAFFAATLLATGSWFFVSTGWLGNADSWYLLGLLAVAFSPWRTTIALTCLLEPFIDERFVLALPLVYVVRQIYFERFDRRQLRAALIDAAVMAAPSVPYIALRLLLLLRSADAGSNVYIQQRLQELRSIPVPWYRWVDGWWQGLRGGWLLVVLAIWLQFRRRLAASALVLASISLATIAMALLIAADVSRSNSALWPAGLLGLLLLLRWRPLWVRYGLPALLAGNFLLPANNVIMGNSWRVRSFYTELEQYRYPPGTMSSAAWLDMARVEDSRKNPGAVLHDLDIAVQLDDRSVEALADRAIFYFNFNQLDRATADADAALAIDPKSPDALFVRGAIYSRRNDPKNAARLLHAALKETTPG